MTLTLSTARTSNKNFYKFSGCHTCDSLNFRIKIIMHKDEFEKIIENKAISTDPSQKPEQSYADKVLCVALDIGENLLYCGGEINRVENTIERVCRAYGAKHVEVFTITSVIIAEIRMADGSYSSQLRRVVQAKMSNDLSKLEKFNALSRKICAEKTEPDEAFVMIKKSKEATVVPTYVSLIGAIFAAGGFAIFFGGNIVDAIIASFVGVIITLVDSNKPSFMNKMASTIICSFIGGLLSYFLSYFAGIAGFSGNVDMVMIGTIMLLIPGISFGYAMRDLVFGDTISGALKTIQAVLLAAMIALGYSLAILLAGGILV